MAEASPICRGKNLTLETVLAFVNAMPLVPMKKAEFHRITETRLKGWTQTHSQIARQLALYYEKDGMCIPRFTRKMSCSEILRYVGNWAKLYFVPNIYTPSLNNAEHKTTNIYAFLKNEVKLGDSSYSKACIQMFGVELNNTDKVRVYLNNFTDLIISDDVMSVNQHLSDCSMPEIYPEITIESAEEFFNYFSVEFIDSVEESSSIEYSLQQIFYGAPGTGKSHTINEETKDEDVIRTTFHPDTDYSTFVGAYKPTTKEVDLRDLSGHKVVENGEVVKEDRIVYEFVAQSFLQAYVSAWKKYADANEDEPQKQYLVIEEINRGNCAQIFGDLFQLLDRNDRGFSDYPIKADADMKRQLQKAFAGLLIAQKDEINAMYEGKDIVSQVLNGDILLLPNNLYIWATMNTSDQSLFPIDSAFKRRWDWTYMPISNAEKDWIIEVDGSKYNWWQFLEKINEKIGSTTNSEDKKLGYFFCKAQDGVISAKTFVGKVIFYLWNDVFKDYEFGDAIFNDEDGSKLSFDKFYTSEGTKSEIVEEKVELFLKNLGIAPLDMDLVDNVDDFASNKNDLTRYSFDGKSKLTKAALGLSIMEKYLSEHKELNYEEIKTTFPDSMLGKISHARLIVEASENLQSYSRYYTGIYKTSDNKEFKIYKQWTRGNIQNMIDFANQQGWSVNIE
ncbi:conserved domain protein [Prevotella sp. CAG:1092]|nr:conserved domain protein [Prevotella sp. CAG:1092]